MNTKNEFKAYIIDDDLKLIEKEIICLCTFLEERGIDVTEILKKLCKLNYYVTNDILFNFKTKGNVNCILTLESGGLFGPIVREGDMYVGDYVIVIKNDCAYNSIYSIHELLHFASIRDSLYSIRGDIQCGIDFYTGKIRNTAINEGITEYFAYKIYKDFFKEDIRYIQREDSKICVYYYSELLIKLLVLESEEKEKALLRAYINNDAGYVFSQIRRCFGLGREYARSVFETGEEVIKRKNEKLTQSYMKDIQQIINYYYENVYLKKHPEDLNFVEKYMEKFNI